MDDRLTAFVGIALLPSQSGASDATASAYAVLASNAVLAKTLILQKVSRINVVVDIKPEPLARSVAARLGLQRNEVIELPSAVRTLASMPRRRPQRGVSAAKLDRHAAET